MKFSKGDVVCRVLPSGIMIGSFMVVVESIGGVCTTVRDVSTGKYYIHSIVTGKQIGRAHV